MKKYFKAIVTIFVIVILSQLSCKILEFENNPLVIDITIEEDFHVQSNGTVFNKDEIVSLSDLYADSGIPLDSIQDVSVKNIRIIISENHTAAGSQLTFLQITFSPNLVNSYSLANMSSPVAINAILDNPIDPFSLVGTLGLNPAGIAQLTSALETSPPPNIRLTLNTTVSAAPVDFKANVIISLQVKYQP